ncbi:MAG: NAD(P)/FAD-dependent oxidoreductase, partial [Chloroflexi bacterium]|nr:NAD(P)/FAD-dependent oxidoreductase [Chloroflexota bacterium]
TRDAKAQMKKAGVKVVLNTEVTADTVYQKKPDAVVVAAGSYPVKLGLAGADKKHVVTDVDVLEGRAQVGNKVVVYRGKRNGCQVAEYLTKEGKEVIVIEPTGQFMSDTGFTIFLPYLERAAKNSRLQLKANTSIEEIKDNSVIVQSDGNREEITGVDSVVFSWAMNANNAKIGDNRLPRDAVDAIREGWEVGVRI